MRSPAKKWDDENTKMFGDIKMKTEKKAEMIEMMTLEIVVIIVSRHTRIKTEKTEMIEMITLEIEKRKNRKKHNDNWGNTEKKIREKERFYLRTSYVVSTI